MENQKYQKAYKTHTNQHPNADIVLLFKKCLSLKVNERGVVEIALWKFKVDQCHSKFLDTT